MSVTSYDGSFSFKQDTLARLGDRAHRPGMSAQDMTAFQNSPFMQSMRRIEELTFQKMSIRDKKRASTDPSFQPKDEDFEAAKSFKYDKAMNYYKTLGVDEYAPQKEVKDAYKRLSLVYHPDKTAGLPSEVKDEYAAIFMELKNGYQTLADNPTRRQYDRERDKDQAAAELNGWKVKERAQFDATEILKKLQEEATSKNPSKVVPLSTKCRLEKFYYGGHKAIKRKRKVKSKKVGWYDDERNFRIDVPAGHAEPFICDFRRQGDHHDDQHPDTLRFSVTSKPHERVERKDNDLRVKQKVALVGSANADPYVTGQVPSIRGRHILLWGLNPFQCAAEGGSAELRVQIQGEGLGSTGVLSFVGRMGAGTEAPTSAPKPAVPGDAAGAEQKGDGRVVITVKHLQTEAEVFLLVSPFATVGDIRKQAITVLGLGRSALLKLLKPLGGQKFTPYQDSTQLGHNRSFSCGGTEWWAVTLTPERAASFLKAVVSMQEAPHSSNLLALAQQTKDSQERAKYLTEVTALQLALLPEYGMKPDEEALLRTLAKAKAEAGKLPACAQLLMRLDACRKQFLAASKGPQGEPGGEPAAGPPPASKGSWEPGTAGAKRFLEHFKLAPPDGFRAREVPAAMRRRLLRQARLEPTCEVLLKPMGGPVTLFTKPTCSLHFYANYEASEACSRVAGPGTLFAVCLSSQACSRGKALGDWDRLKYELIPLLQATCFKQLRMGRAILPRPLADTAAVPDPAEKAKHQLPMPWKRLGDEAYRRRDCWLALCYYASCLEDLPQNDSSWEAARVLSNRAGCFAEVKEYSASLAAARMATELQPRWGRAWSRLGYAASMCGSPEESCQAYSRAVELAPSEANVKALYEAVRKADSPGAEAAHLAKEKGNEAVRVSEWSSAVAAYTAGLAQLPPEAWGDQQDQLTFLRCVLFCNRSGAFARLMDWPAAVRDGESSIEAKADFAKAHTRLGIALLGSRQCEKAYNQFGKALLLQEDYQQARKGRNECLREILRWRSVPAMKRITGRLGDAKRSKGSTRVFAITDVHFDHKCNEEWSHAIDDSLFQEDVLIIAGDMAGTKGAVVRGLTTLKSKFRRVFYTVGHHEMWLHYGEQAKYPDSIAKLMGIFETCDELGVDIVADAVCEGVFVVPIHSWYHPDFDEMDPWPDPSDKIDQQCRWPMDPDDQVWKYMLKLNEAFLGLPFHGTVITFSHFLPRRGLPLPFWHGAKTAKTSGCERIDDQVRGVRSKLHVFGHSHQRYFAVHQGVSYVQQPLGFSSEQAASEDFLPMLMVYDGRSTCARPWDITNNHPR